MMLERDRRIEVAGARPSAYARVKVGREKRWNDARMGIPFRGRVDREAEACRRIPYVFAAPNQRKEHTAIRNNIGPARAWRAPNHPQAAVHHHVRS